MSDIELKPKQQDAYNHMIKGNNILITGPAGTGKCLGRDTPVIMYDGSIKKVQDISTGEFIMGDDSTPRTILSTTIGRDKMYKVTTEHKDSYVVNSSHILTLSTDSIIDYFHDTYYVIWGNKCGLVEKESFNNFLDAKNYKDKIERYFIDLPIKDCLNNRYDEFWSRCFKGIYTSLEFIEKKLEIDPYILGLWLFNTKKFQFKISTNVSLKIIASSFFNNRIRNIPYEYLTSSKEQRTQLLIGILDDVLLSKDYYEIIDTDKILLDNVIYLTKSLGYPVKVKATVNNDIITYTVGIYNKQEDKILTKIVDISECGGNVYYGFEIDGNNRFVLGNFLVTHNTAVIKKFMKIHGASRNIAVTSTTGTSALLINGTTLHSYLGIGCGVSNVDILYAKICSQQRLIMRWRRLECLFVDEISMLSPDLFDKLESIARKIRKNEKPFGGIQLILSGDFLQLPVVGTDKFCFDAISWSTCIEHIVYLDEIIRQDDFVFQNILNNIRMGNVTEEVVKTLDKRIGISLVNDYGIKPTKLYALNRDVDAINNKELDKLAINDVSFNEYTMEIKVYSDVKNREMVIEKFKKNCNAPEHLQICVGAQVMLLINLDLMAGLVNGSRGVVKSFIDDIPIVKFINGSEILIDWHTWEIEENNDKIMQVRQIPLKVAYAISIHKSQGTTLDYVEIDLASIFEYGQSYVALSRVKRLEGLCIYDIDYNLIKAHPRAINFYKKL